MFAGVASIKDFASVLAVPANVIHLVVTTTCPCRIAECPFDAIEGNGNHCLAHWRSWYHLSNACGGDLLGPEFL